MRAGIGPVGQEIGGIEHEIEGQVFPTAMAPNAGTAAAAAAAGGGILPGVALFNSPPAAASTQDDEASAYVDIVGDAQLFPQITGHITLTQVVSVCVCV